MNITKYDDKAYKGIYKEVWGATSETNPDRVYSVTLTVEDVWQCGCPRWTQNASRPECKHIRFIKNFRKQGFKREEVEVTEQVKKALTRFSAVEV